VGGESGEGGELAGRRETGDVTDLGDDEQGDEDADAPDPGENGDARVVLGARPDLPLHGRELAVPRCLPSNAGVALTHERGADLPPPQLVLS
jgi:hypothetical protein